jgi:hypothetical protein
VTVSDYAQRGRIGAFRLHATHDPKETTRAARKAFGERFYRDIPDDLPEAERDRRAEMARRAHFTQLARQSALSRRKAA